MGGRNSTAPGALRSRDADKRRRRFLEGDTVADSRGLTTEDRVVIRPATARDGQIVTPVEAP